MAKDSNPFFSNKSPICPPYLLEKARQRPPVRIAVANAGFPLPMEASKLGTETGIMVPVFVGREAEIRTEAARLNWDISEFEIVEADGEEACAVKASLLGREGKAGVVMKGQLHTDVFMAALVSRHHGVRTGDRLVHLFHISEPETGRTLIVSDAAVNIAPDIETRKQAMRLAEKMAIATGIARPKIALLSATESVIKAMPSSVEARELSDWAKTAMPDSDVCGPLALDLILSEESARNKKMSGEPVAGHADIIIVPDIVSGNTLFKSLVYLAGGCAGGIVLGGSVPILLTSRSDPAEARLASIALAAIMN